jgi:hypothetical protein
VSYGFTKLADYPLLGFALNVETGLTGNAAFPTPPAPVAEITAAREDFALALDATHNGGPLQTLEKNLKRGVLVDKLRLDAAYVQMRAGKDLAAMISSGYLPVSRNRARVPLPKPLIQSLSNQYTGMLILNVQPLVNARSYEVQVKNGGGWMPLAVFGHAQRIPIPNLTPGQSYSVQARAIGGSNGYSEWSDPVARIVT